MSTVINGSSPSITFSDGSTQSTAFTTPVSIANGGTGATTLAGANIATTNSSTQSITSINTFGFKNRIINGGMVIDQRNAGSSYTGVANNQYTLDRWVTSVSQISKMNVQQNANSITPPVGFSNYLGITVGTAVTPLASGDYFQLIQKIEGFNSADLAYGTANAKTITLSFWVYSNLTGTFGGGLSNSNQSRTYPFSYTISSANTWEQKTITIAGDTSGSWIGATNGIGLWINFGLGTGTTYSGTAGSWSSSLYVNVTGNTNVMASTSNYWYVTGVQLEVGSQATSFDFRDYGRELLLCQRYYEKMYEPCGMGRCNNTPAARFFARFTVLKRTTPTITGTGSFAVSDLYTTDAVQTANQGIYGSTAITTSGFSFSILSSTLDSPTPFVTGSLAANLANTGVLTGSAEL